MEEQFKNQVHYVSGKNTLGVTTLVLGVVSLIGSWIPFFNVISILIATAGIIIGICAFVSFLRKKSSNCILTVIGTVLSIIAISIASIINNAVVDSSKSTKVSSGSTKVSNSSKNVTANSSSEKQQSVSETETTEEYKVGDVISFDDKYVTVTKVKRNYDTGDRFSKPKSGKEFVKITLKVENKSNYEVSLNPYDFKVQDKNGLIVDHDSSTYSLEDDSFSGSSLAPGGKLSGSIVFEVPKNDNNLKLTYQPSFWSSKRITIKL